MTFFERPILVRRFVGLTDKYNEITISIDVQAIAPSGAEFGPEGQRKNKNAKSWGDEPIIAADPVAGTRADWIFWRGAWWECTSCEFLDNTILHHWRGEWTRQPEGSEKNDGATAKVKLTPAV